MYFLFGLLLLEIIYAVFLVSQFYNVIIKKNAPLVTTGQTTIKKIISELDLKENQTVFELGCGRAIFLRTVEKTILKINLVGVENLHIIYFLNNLFLRLIGSKIKLLRNDIFAVNLKDADIIYCYLFSETMKKIGDKVLQECKKGTQIVSRTFSIPQLQPEKIIVIENKRVFFYKMEIVNIDKKAKKW